MWSLCLRLHLIKAMQANAEDRLSPSSILLCDCKLALSGKLGDPAFCKLANDL